VASVGTGWQKSPRIEGKPGSERQIEVIARRQLQLITSSQLLAAGMSRKTIESWLKRRRLHPVHHGVYVTHSLPVSRDQRWLGGVLACGPEALLSREPAAMVQEFVEPAAIPAHVTVPSGRGRSRAGIVVHRSYVDPRDRRKVGAIPCTSADRILVDLAPRYAEPELEVLLVAAESLGLIKRGRLGELVAERAGRPGMARLAGLLRLDPIEVRSRPEVLLLPVCRMAGLPRPRLNHPVDVPTQSRPLVVDLVWPEIRLAIELDSQRFHGDWEQAERDRERDQALALAGWACHRFVRRVVAEEPARAAGRLRELYALRVGIGHLGLSNGGSDRPTGAARA
jgi:hypothetical protein